MKEKRTAERTSGAAIALAAILLAACHGDDPTNGPSRSPSLTLPSGLQLQVEVDPATLPRGEATQITVRLRNPTASPVTLDFPSSCQFLFEVRDAAHHVVAPEPVACATVITALTVPPGGSRERSFRWDGQSAAGAPLAHGRYGVVGVLPTTPQSYRTQEAPVWLED